MMNKQEKIELLKFCIDWELKQSTSLSEEFLLTYTELSQDEIKNYTRAFIANT